ncbi:hypothetical protein SAMN05661080_04136 [Modestobacter sp. DSM 44400]|uniref:hypothetical protein n=1 Tax=Modestobacter sp. DSM 44400 TaxID=1550230 RepID=UPI000894CEED|nr:hypothetical protein [Modestobacter sp. DSM 44400]SDY64000.1 hypothetical protein SAMN05661080_04136 [Modestobacter sp. DSM 44400]
MDVLTMAWHAAGAPDVEPPTREGLCARCGAGGPLIAATEVVSRSFTGYDGWADPGRTGVCPPCAWAYRHPPLRATAHLVTRAGQLQALTPTEVGEHLEVPLSADRALIVPLHPGRKHLAPTAAWGRVTIEDAHLSWAPADVERLAALRRVRRLGFGSRMLTAPAPPWSMLSRLPAENYPALLADWAALDPWQSRRPWLDLALYATVADTGVPPAAPRPRSPLSNLRKARR